MKKYKIDDLFVGNFFSIDNSEDMMCEETEIKYIVIKHKRNFILTIYHYFLILIKRLRSELIYEEIFTKGYIAEHPKHSKNMIVRSFNTYYLINKASIREFLDEDEQDNKYISIVRIFQIYNKINEKK